MKSPLVRVAMMLIAMVKCLFVLKLHGGPALASLRHAVKPRGGGLA